MREALAPGAHSSTIELRAGRFHYISWGSEHTERPAAVLLHGMTSSALSWHRLGPALADRYRVYAPDMRGHGDSIHPRPGSFGLRETADDVVDFLQALHLEQPLLLGHSWGGAIALLTASGAWSAQPPPALADLILEDPAWKFTTRDPERNAASFTSDIALPVDACRAKLAREHPMWSTLDIAAKIDALGKVTHDTIVSIFTDAGKSGNLLPWLAHVTAPTLLVRADAYLDTTLKEAAWTEAKQLLNPRSSAVEIAGASHYIHHDRSEAFLAVVNAFLSRDRSAP
jgi:pimeloyl-ACP methyl ester carboxylesterase